MQRTSMNFAVWLVALGGFFGTSAGLSQDQIQFPSASDDDEVFRSLEAELESPGGDPQQNVDSKGVEDDGFWNSSPSATSSRNVDVTDSVKIDEIIAPASEYSYASFGKSDPFVPPVISSTGVRKSVAEAPEVPIISVLQRYEVSELSLVGVWETASGQKKLLVTTPNGEAIVARNGDPIGKKGGLIVGVEKSRVLVREFQLAPDGTRQYSEANLVLGANIPSSDGEGGASSSEDEDDLDEEDEDRGDEEEPEADSSQPVAPSDSFGAFSPSEGADGAGQPAAQALPAAAQQDDSQLSEREFKKKAYKQYVESVQKR